MQERTLLNIKLDKLQIRGRTLEPHGMNRCDES